MSGRNECFCPFLTCWEGVEELRVATAAGEAVLSHSVIAIVRVVRTLEYELKKGLCIKVASSLQ